MARQKKELMQKMIELDEERKNLQKEETENSERLEEIESLLAKMMVDAKAEEAKHKISIKIKNKEVDDWIKMKNREIQKLIEMQRTATIMEDMILDILPKIREANYISLIMKKNIEFQFNISDWSNDPENATITIHAIDHTNDITNNWSMEKFIIRYFLMKEIYSSFEDLGREFELPMENDPFYDNVTNIPQLIGCASVNLKPISHQIEINNWINILDGRGNIQGRLKIGLYPCDQGISFFGNNIHSMI